MLFKFYGFAGSAALTVLLGATHWSAMEDSLYPIGGSLLQFTVVLLLALSIIYTSYRWLELHRELARKDEQTFERLPL